MTRLFLAAVLLVLAGGSSGCGSSTDPCVLEVETITVVNGLNQSRVDAIRHSPSGSCELVSSDEHNVCDLDGFCSSKVTTVYDCSYCAGGPSS